METTRTVSSVPCKKQEKNGENSLFLELFLKA